MEICTPSSTQGACGSCPLLPPRSPESSSAPLHQWPPTRSPLSSSLANSNVSPSLSRRADATEDVVATEDLVASGKLVERSASGRTSLLTPPPDSQNSRRTRSMGSVLD